MQQKEISDLRRKDTELEKQMIRSSFYRPTPHCQISGNLKNHSDEKLVFYDTLRM